MLQLACHNSEIDQGIGKMKMTRCPDKCGKQWRLKQRNPGWQKQKEEKKKEEKGKNQEKKQNKPKKERMMKVKKVAEEQKIWDKEEEVAKFGEEAKKLVSQRFYK